MKVKDVVQQFVSVSEDPYTYMNDFKDRTEKNVIARFSMYAPVELIHASGAHPMMPWRSNDMIDLAHSRVRTNWCWITRSFLDDLFKDKLPFLDGVIPQEICLLTRVYSLTLARNFQWRFFHFFYVAPELFNTDKDLKMPAFRWDFTMWHMRDMKRKLEQFMGKEITDDDLGNSIALFNKQRALQRELLELRRKKPALLKSKEITAIIHCATFMPVEEYNPLLEGLLAELKKKAAPQDSGKVRIVIGGHLCAPVRYDYLDLIEEAGGLIVDDDNFIGTRYCVTDVKVDKKPLEALARNVIDTTIPHPAYTYPGWDWPEYEVGLVRKNDAKAFITTEQKGCPAHYGWYPYIRQALNEAGIPELMLQVAHEEFNLAPIRTRVQAFIETVR